MTERPLPSYDGDDAYIFVTYSHEDADLVYPHLRWLQDQGFNVWWDEGISPGAVWRAEVAEAIEHALFSFFSSHLNRPTPNTAIGRSTSRSTSIIGLCSPCIWSRQLFRVH